MTTFKKIYNANKDDRPATVSIGCELATREQIETDCHRLVPANTRVVFLKAPYEVVYLPCGGASYSKIKDLLKEQGFGASWVIKSVWITEEEPENYI